MEYGRVVRKRRMVRNFRTDVQVDDDDLREILDLAQHYPSAGYSQGIALVVIRDPEVKKKVVGDEETLPNGRPNFQSNVLSLVETISIRRSFFSSSS